MKQDLMSPNRLDFIIWFCLALAAGRVLGWLTGLLVLYLS